ncbi:MAG: Flagellar assembly factor FliW [Planctomycetota bacterium]|jgi:flagellar assembly factor FliW
MLVQTTRFGSVEVDETRLLEFPAGLLGFSRSRRFALLQPDDRGVFFWLQSVESADVAFVVTDPCLWDRDYAVTLRREQAAELGLDEAMAPQLLVIVNRRDHGITANMQGPLVIHPIRRVGMQVVLADRRWTTRHELVSVTPAARVATA